MRLSFIALTLTIAAEAALAEPTQLTPSEAHVIAEVLSDAGDHGLPTPGISDDPTSAVLAYARAQTGQRLRPRDVNVAWAIEPPARDLSGEFSSARESGALAAWLSALAPIDQRYTDLVSARRRYAHVIAAGGWTALSAALREGDRGASVLQLRDRLMAEGYDAPHTDGEVFDAELSTSIALFQARNGLSADGIVGPETLAALNVPPEARLATIDANLERWRWLPRSLPADRIEVNIAAAELILFENDRTALSMRVIVGATNHQTPMFVDAIDAVIFNPSWTVPVSIARNEIGPAAARDPGYLAAHGFSVVDGRYIQAPGPGNALGRIKFDLPNAYSVYLHDTPNHALFERERRTLSHGCVRLAEPRALAERILGYEGWTSDEVGALLAETDTKIIPLARSLPVYFLYQTAWADSARATRFAQDAYGWDTALQDALEHPAPAVAAQPGDTMCSADASLPVP